MPFYERGPVRIHYEEAGSGFPLLSSRAAGSIQPSHPGRPPHPSTRCVAGAKPRRVLPRAGAITWRFESLEKLWRRRDERTFFCPSRRDSKPCFSLERASPCVVISPTSTPGATARCHPDSGGGRLRRDSRTLVKTRTTFAWNHAEVPNRLTRPLESMD